MHGEWYFAAANANWLTDCECPVSLQSIWYCINMRREKADRSCMVNNDVDHEGDASSMAE